MNEGNSQPPGNARLGSPQPQRQRVPMLEGLRAQRYVLRENLKRIDTAIDALEANPIVAAAIDGLSEPIQPEQ